MAVSRRVDRRAVVRNRIKRVIRESFRRHFLAPAGMVPDRAPGAGTAYPLDIVVLPRPGIATISNRRLFASLDAHWMRLEARLRETSHG
jgi:ribonuclease P protein component